MRYKRWMDDVMFNLGKYCHEISWSGKSFTFSAKLGHVENNREPQKIFKKYKSKRVNPPNQGKPKHGKLFQIKNWKKNNFNCNVNWHYLSVCLKWPLKNWNMSIWIWKQCKRVWTRPISRFPGFFRTSSLRPHLIFQQVARSLISRYNSALWLI